MSDIRDFSPQVGRLNHEKFVKAKLILVHAHESASALLKVFDIARKSRGTPGGATTVEEQDLLRAMLVMASAGLDSMVKQLIRATLATLVERDEKVRKQLEVFIGRQLRDERSSSTASTEDRFLARVLAAELPRAQVIQEYMDDLTGESLQSSEQLMKVVFALGLDPAQLTINPDELREIFKIRNKIVHEMDINFDVRNRRRESRARPAMVSSTNLILEVGERILIGVSAKAA